MKSSCKYTVYMQSQSHRLVKLCDRVCGGKSVFVTFSFKSKEKKNKTNKSKRSSENLCLMKRAYRNSYHDSPDATRFAMLEIIFGRRSLWFQSTHLRCIHIFRRQKWIFQHNLMRECILAYDEDYLMRSIDEEYFGVWLFLVMTTISWDVVTNLKNPWFYWARTKYVVWNSSVDVITRQKSIVFLTYSYLIIPTM